MRTIAIPAALLVGLPVALGGCTQTVAFGPSDGGVDAGPLPADAGDVEAEAQARYDAATDRMVASSQDSLEWFLRCRGTEEEQLRESLMNVEESLRRQMRCMDARLRDRSLLPDLAALSECYAAGMEEAGVCLDGRECADGDDGCEDYCVFPLCEEGIDPDLLDIVIGCGRTDLIGRPGGPEPSAGCDQ